LGTVSRRSEPPAKPRASAEQQQTIRSLAAIGQICDEQLLRHLEAAQPAAALLGITVCVAARELRGREIARCI